jgi:hypothetical protein
MVGPTGIANNFYKAVKVIPAAQSGSIQFYLTFMLTGIILLVSFSC